MSEWYPFSRISGHGNTVFQRRGVNEDRHPVRARQGFYRMPMLHHENDGRCLQKLNAHGVGDFQRFFRPDGTLYFSDVRLAQEEHTQA